MQMLMIIVESTHRERVEAALAEHRAPGLTEIPTVYGRGQTGDRLGSRAFPESSSIIFTVVEDGKADELLAAIDSSCADCRQAMRLIVWGVDRMSGGRRGRYARSPVRGPDASRRWAALAQLAHRGDLVVPPALPTPD